MELLAPSEQSEDEIREQRLRRYEEERTTDRPDIDSDPVAQQAMQVVYKYVMQKPILKEHFKPSRKNIAEANKGIDFMLYPNTPTEEGREKIKGVVVDKFNQRVEAKRGKRK